MSPPRKVATVGYDLSNGLSETALVRYPLTVIATIPEGFNLTEDFMVECDKAFEDGGQHELTPKQVLNLAKNLGYDT